MSIGAISGNVPDFSSMRANFEKMQAQRFEGADADKSGTLSLDEFKQAHANRPQGPANVAGAPSAEEIFAEIDTDGNGEVSSEEFSSFKPPRPPGGSGAPPAGGGLASDTLASLLALQEESSSESDTSNDLISQLLEAISQGE
ncbi:MAG: EF-hand domain-containing protein [Hyphomicrobiaceae bacterium]|nr:EF-hand domain-containing protein [Hyphomicrobiaceae bacterium]